MITTTKAQRKALKAVYDRDALYATPMQEGKHIMPRTLEGIAVWQIPEREDKPMTYRQFRKLVEPTFGMDNAIVVPWCGMWLAIETDGYTHS